jgi:D-methionine transport system substrate-binding protein
MIMSNTKYIVGGIAAIAIAGAAYLSFGNHSDKKTADDKTVTVGIMTDTKQGQDIWKVISKTAKDKYGITVKFKTFTDYSQPNKALSDGEVDVNAFQHYAFLNDWNDKNKTDLVSIGDTVISPIRIYSHKAKDVKDIPNGSTIVVPNDATNESRSLYVLKNAGLISLKDGLTTATVKDITSNPKNLKIKEVDASQTARSLDDVGAAVINNNYATTAGLTNDDSIFTEPVNQDSHQWINVIAARKADKNKKILKEFVKAYQSQATKDAYEKAYPDGSTITAWDIKLK